MWVSLLVDDLASQFADPDDAAVVSKAVVATGILASACTAADYFLEIFNFEVQVSLLVHGSHTLPRQHGHAP